MRHIPYIPPYDRIPYGFCPADEDEINETKEEDNMDYPVDKWIKIEKGAPLPDDGIFLVAYYSSFHEKFVVADCFATCSNGVWYWWEDGYADEVEFKITHFMIPSPPKE